MNPEQTYYINVDLVLRSEADIAPLGQWFEPRASVLFCGEMAGRHELVVEFETSIHLLVLAEESGASDVAEGQTSRFEADDCITKLIELIRMLPQELRQMWDGCTARIFDIGIEAGTRPPRFVQELSAETVRQICDVGGSIWTTVYAYGSEDRRANVDTLLKAREDIRSQSQHTDP